jgi:predicted amidohydrolase
LPGERAATYAASLELTSRIDPGSADLVVWPEGSTGFNVDPILDPAIGEAIAAEAARIGAVLLAGGDRPVSDTEWINANVVWDGDGNLVGEYRKRHPVPFGEYVPARPMFDVDSGSQPGPPRHDPGRRSRAVRAGRGLLRIGDLVRVVVRPLQPGARAAGADLLVVATSQASYPYSHASDQLIGMTRMRSAELGVDVDPRVGHRPVHVHHRRRRGRREDRGGRDHLAGGHGPVPGDGPTLYTRLGDWVQLVGMAWLLDRSIRAGLRRSGRDVPVPTGASSH